MTADRELAWDERLEAKPSGWYVGQPSYHNERGGWLLYAFDPAERRREECRSSYMVETAVGL